MPDERQVDLVDDLDEDFVGCGKKRIGLLGQPHRLREVIAEVSARMNKLRRGRPGRDDLDLASPGLVKVFDNRRGDTYPDMPWEPKAAFTTLAKYYQGYSRGG